MKPLSDNPRADFVRLQQVLRGRRLEGGVVVSKMLYFMLARDEGCDSEMTRVHWVMRFGWNTARHRYSTRACPAVLTRLMQWCGLAAIPERVAVRLPGAGMPRLGHFRGWDCGARDIWLLPEPERLRIVIRSASAASSHAGPDLEALPEPIASPRRYTTLPTPLRCPHCRGGSTAFRVLPGAWVCPACSRSIEMRVPDDAG